LRKDPIYSRVARRWLMADNRLSRLWRYEAVWVGARQDCDILRWISHWRHRVVADLRIGQIPAPHTHWPERSPATTSQCGRGLVLLAIVITACALALNAPSWAKAGSAIKPTPKEASYSPTVHATEKASLYDVEASGTNIKLVLESLARCSGANIAVSPDVSGEVTAYLKQMPLNSILDHLSAVLGFAWRKADNAYLVTSKDKFEKPPEPKPEPAPPEPQLLVWECRYVKPADAVTTIQSLWPKIKIVQGPGAMTPTLGNTSGGIGAAGTGGSSYGVSTSTSQSAGGSTGGSCRVALIGDPADIAKAKEALTQLDVARQQVSIKVTITEIKTSGEKDLGVEWTYGDLVVKETPTSSGIRFGRFAKEGMTFTGVISALMKAGKAKLLAEPNISVIDGENASILIGDRILFPKLIGYSQFGTPIYDKEEEPVGISLQIAPKVTGPDAVLLTLYPQVSLVTSYLKTGTGDYPQISTRESRTTVSVKNGQTLAIGGLIRDDEIKNGSKIPFLGDLPIIGNLFRQSKTTKERNEIVILLTPTIMETK